MMKKIMLITAIFAVQIGFAQVKKNVGQFDELRVFDRINVTLVQSNEERVEITGTRSDEVEVVNKNGELKIRMKLGKLLDGEDVSATLYFKKIESIDANEGSFVGSEHNFKQSEMELSSQEGAGIKVVLDVQKAKVKTYTGGTVTLSGKAVNQEIVVNTGGIVKAKNLKTSQSTVTVSAGGEVEVNASELVDAKVRAGGNIRIFGNPKKVNQKTSLGGSIDQAAE